MISYTALIILTVIFDIKCCTGALEDCKEKLVKFGLDSKSGIYNYIYILKFKDLIELTAQFNKKTGEELTTYVNKSVYSRLFRGINVKRKKATLIIYTPKEFCDGIVTKEVDKIVKNALIEKRKAESMLRYLAQETHNAIHDEIEYLHFELSKLGQQENEWKHKIEAANKTIETVTYASEKKKCVGHILAFKYHEIDGNLLEYGNDSPIANLITSHDMNVKYNVIQTFSFKKTIDTVFNFFKKSKPNQNPILMEMKKYAVEYFKYHISIVQSNDKNYRQYTVSNICKANKNGPRKRL